jgi:two-component system, sensor histidine kinase LadS
LFGIYYGLLLLMIFYNLLYFIFLRKLHYLFYVLYVCGILTYQMSRNGTGFQYVWSSYPQINSYIDNIGLFVGISSMLFFAIYFLELKTRNIFLRNVLLFAFGLRIILFGFEIHVPIHFQWEIFDLLFVQLVLFVGYLEYKRGYRPAKWYVLAYAIIDIAFIITWLERLNWLESGILTVYSFNIGTVIQFILLSISIGESIRETYRQRNETQQLLLQEYKRNNDLQEQVNKELEQKVKERTLELEERNDMVLKQKVEIDAINDNLEMMVRKRTKQLQDKNDRIKEYAFSNSHIVRGPLARILGLVSIAEHEPKVIELIGKNAKELDVVIKEMTQILAEEE